MDTIGLDLHKRESQLCVLTEAGEIVERRIVTSRERFTAVLGSQPSARSLLEAETGSGWVAGPRESLGHEVIVADPNFAPMYATRRRGVKTDRRDARTLAEACRLGAYRPVHRASAPQRHVRAQLAVREALIRTRTRYVNVVKALARRDGLRLPPGNPVHTEAKLAALPLSAPLAGELAPLRALLDPLNQEIAGADERLAAVAAADPVVRRLQTAPGVGPVTAVAVVATLDDVTRVASAHHVAAYLGLTPREYSSGEQQHRGRISKTGSPRMRALLVEAAWRGLRSDDPAATPLRAGAERSAPRRRERGGALPVGAAPAGLLRSPVARHRRSPEPRAPSRP